MLTNLVNESLNPVFNPAVYPMLPLRKALKPRNQKKVLIIDDDQDMSEVLQSFLEKDEHYAISTAQDPFEAMDMMTEQVFDLIVLDWNLPKMNGLETLIQTEKWFRCDPNLLLEWEDRRVPVIIFTGNEKAICKAPYTKHFRYSGYVNKSNTIETIVNSLKQNFKKALV